MIPQANEEITVIYVGEEVERSHTQTLLQGFIVHSPKLGIIDLQKVKSKNLKGRSMQEFVIKLYQIQKKIFDLNKKKNQRHRISKCIHSNNT